MPRLLLPKHLANKIHKDREETQEKTITVIGQEGVSNIKLPDNNIITALDNYYRQAKGIRTFRISNNPLAKE